MKKRMQLFPHVWQRVFMYAILLVFASHVVSFVVFRLGVEDDMHMRVLDGLASSATAALEGKSTEAAKILPEFFQNHGRALWIERPNGELLAGEVKPGLSYSERHSLPLSLVRAHGAMGYMETGNPAAPYLVAAPVTLLDDEAILYLSLERMPPPPMHVLFIQGLIAVCFIGGTLSIGAAWRIARPLRRLRSEVLAIAGGNLNARVSVTGAKEIRQVAEAVNSMAKNLSDNIIEMRELVANISHEMRSPLARMSISTAILEEGVRALAHEHTRKSPSDVEEALPLVLDAEGSLLAVKHVGRMAQEIEHMEGLVGSCLLNSKLDLQQELPKIAPLNLSLLCKKILPRYEALLQAKNLSFSKTIRDGLWVDGDEELLSLVLTNLLDNAIKYTKEGGQVRLCLREEGGAALSLENSYKVIDEAELPRLFEPFFKRPEDAGGTTGVGLGLSLASKIARCHHGSVTAENGEIGLLFTVRLACSQPPEAGFVEWFFERHNEAISG